MFGANVAPQVGHAVVAVLAEGALVLADLAALVFRVAIPVVVPLVHPRALPALEALPRLDQLVHVDHAKVACKQICGGALVLALRAESSAGQRIGWEFGCAQVLVSICGWCYFRRSCWCRGGEREDSSVKNNRQMAVFDVKFYLN